MVVAAIDWTPVLVVLIGAIPSTIAALASLSNQRSLRTPSGTSIGRQVENVQHTALANHYRIRALANEVGASDPVEAVQEAQQIEGVTGRREHDG